MWYLFPPEIKEKIISKISLKELVKISEINKNCNEYVQNRIRSYMLEQLENVVASEDQQRMKQWKEIYYDKLPIDDPERKIIIYAIFFFSGKYCIPINFIPYIFQCIIPEEYQHFVQLGYLFCQDIKIPALQEIKYEDILTKTPEVDHPLFGKMTVHNPYFSQVFKEQLSKLFEKTS